MQPRGGCGGGPLTRRARVARGVVEQGETLPPRRPLPLIERREVVREAGAVLSATDDLHASTSPTLFAAEDRHPSIHPDRGNPLLPTDPMPLLGSIGIRLDMRLILVLQFIPLRVVR